MTDLARALGWLPAGAYVTSPRARPAALMSFHTADYVAALLAAEAEGAVSEAVRIRHGLGTLSNPVHGLMFRRPATSAGGALLAAEMVRAGGVVMVPGAGTHHAFADRAGGFCYLNDPVLALLHLRRLGLRRLAYVDLDAHHCDGVSAAFEGDRDLLLISVHEEDRWPRTGALSEEGGGTHLNLPVPRGFNDTEMAAARDGVILPALEAFQPEAVLLQCGADAVEEDPLSRLALSNNAHVAAVLAIRAQTDRLIVTGGGGYNPWSVARCWTRVWGALGGHEAPERLEGAARSVLEALVWPGRAAGRNPPADWSRTLADPPREGPIPAGVGARLASGRPPEPGLRRRAWV